MPGPLVRWSTGKWQPYPTPALLHTGQQTCNAQSRAAEANALAYNCIGGASSLRLVPLSL